MCPCDGVTISFGLALLPAVSDFIRSHVWAATGSSVRRALSSALPPFPHSLPLPFLLTKGICAFPYVDCVLCRDVPCASCLVVGNCRSAIVCSMHTSVHDTSLLCIGLWGVCLLGGGGGGLMGVVGVAAAGLQQHVQLSCLIGFEFRSPMAAGGEACSAAAAGAGCVGGVSEGIWWVRQEKV